MTDDDTRHSGDREAQAANLFDLRRILGGLFLLYGLILVVVGLLDSHAELARAAGLHINLLAGLGMALLGGAFLVWARTRPLAEQLAEAEAEAPSRERVRERA